MPDCSYKKKPNKTVCGYHKKYNNIGRNILTYMIKKLNVINPCFICGEEMGLMNPRQFCGKTYCYYCNTVMHGCTDNDCFYDKNNNLIKYHSFCFEKFDLTRRRR